MANLRKWVKAAAVAGALSLAVAACGGGGGEGEKPSATQGAKGGTLYYLQHYPFESTDPTRIYYGLELANFRRLVYRGLFAYPVSTDPKIANTPTPDLSVDMGTTPDNGKTWTFTIKDGVKWQDGSEIVCEDFKYGMSRKYATILTGGPNYEWSYLDIPKLDDGTPAYKGPYKGDGQDLFDKAVTCNGDKEITYHFNKPWPDFPLAAATLMTADPYKESIDKGDKSKWTIFSNGPYMIEGGTTWNKDKGVTLVRNPEYDASTDDPTLRQALPDKIVYDINGATTSSDTINERLIADSGSDKCAVTPARIGPQYFSQVEEDPAVKARTVNVTSPYTFYLVPNFDRLDNVEVRRALAVATNKTAQVKALGGALSAEPADSVVNPGVAGYTPNPAFADIPDEGDPAAAKQILEDAGVEMPYPITFTYASSTTADKVAAALKQTWDEAGFDVKLDGLQDTYYDVINQKDKKSDIVSAGWGADWPSMMTVLPPLFDSRPNITADSLGQNYGDYVSEEFEALVDQAATASDLDSQNAILQEADALLGEDVAYIPTYNLRFPFLYGSEVTGYINTPGSSMNPDLGAIGVNAAVCS